MREADMNQVLYEIEYGYDEDEAVQGDVSVIACARELNRLREAPVAEEAPGPAVDVGQSARQANASWRWTAQVKASVHGIRPRRFAVSR